MESGVYGDWDLTNRKMKKGDRAWIGRDMTGWCSNEAKALWGEVEQVRWKEKQLW